MTLPHDIPAWAKAARPANVRATPSEAPEQYAPIADVPEDSAYTHRGHAAQYGLQRRWGFTPRLIILHTTESGSPVPTAAQFESSMTYDAWRPDTVSATGILGALGEYGLDVPEDARAWTTGRWNDEGLHLEIVGYRNWNPRQWRARPLQMAKLEDVVVDWCQRYDIPAVWLDAQAVAEGASRHGATPRLMGTRRGITDHWEANLAARSLGASLSSTTHNDIGPYLREVFFEDVLPRIKARLSQTVPEPPQPEPPPIFIPPGVTMDDFICLATCTEGDVKATCAVWAGGYKTWVHSRDAFIGWARDNGHPDLSASDVVQVDARRFRAMGVMLGPIPTRGAFVADAWGV